MSGGKKVNVAFGGGGVGKEGEGSRGEIQGCGEVFGGKQGE